VCRGIIYGWSRNAVAPCGVVLWLEREEVVIDATVKALAGGDSFWWRD
jgi:hypothetical protein